MSSGTLARRPAVLLALGLCAFGGVVTLLGRLAGGPAVEQKRVQFTTESGAQAYPSFSPDGKQLAYSARGATADDAFHIVVRAISGSEQRQITSGESNDIGPVWSPDGATIAFLRVNEGRGQAMIVPAAGGSERQLAEFVAPGEDAFPPPSIAWTRDGKSLVAQIGAEKQPPALALISVSDGALRRITNPPEGSQGDGSPAVSPDGKSLAFVRSLDDDRADVFVTDLNGAPARQLSFDNHQIHGLAWSGGGQDVLYASNRGSGWRIWRLPAYGGSPRDVLSAGDHAGYPAVAPKGDRLAFTDTPWVSSVWIAALGEEGPRKDRQIIRGAARESGAAWSPDGTKIANISEVTGQPEIWIQDAGGANRVQLTRMDGPRMRNIRWSPDGRTILFETRGSNGVVTYTVPASGGKVTRVMSDAWDGSWSRDGKSIYYSSGPQVWHVSADGSNPEQLSHRMGSGGPVESVDGKWIYYRSRRNIWRMPVGGGKEEEFIVPERDLLYSPMQVDANGLYYSEFDRSARGVIVMFYDFEAKKSRPVMLVKGGDFGEGFSISPDGKQILYTKTDRSQTNIIVIENFR